MTLSQQCRPRELPTGWICPVKALRITAEVFGLMLLLQSGTIQLLPTEAVRSSIAQTCKPLGLAELLTWLERLCIHGGCLLALPALAQPPGWMVLGWAPLPLVVVIPWVRPMSTR